MALPGENLQSGATTLVFHDLNHARASAKSIACRMPDSARIAFAGAFCTAVLETYWQAACRGRSCDWGIARASAAMELSALERSEDSLAARMGAMLPLLPISAAGHVLGTMYTALLPQSVRSELGAYYTPPALVEQLISNVSQCGFDWKSGRVLDPACGGAAFMTPAAAKIVGELRAAGVSEGEILEHVSSHLRGVEIDPFAGWMTQVLLELSLLDVSIAAGKRLPVIVHVDDALHADRPESALCDLVIGNPPYRRTTLSAELRQSYARSLYGHANLYGLFVDLAVRWTRHGGLIAYVTPTSFLGGQYFKSLRSLLLEEAPPAIIDFVGERSGVFEDVLQETLLAVYRRGGSADGRTMVRSLVASGKDVYAMPLGEFETCGNNGGPWLFPRTDEQRVLLRKVVSLTCRLSDHGLTVMTGQLVWNRHKDQLRTTPGPGRLPLIWAEAVSPDGGFKLSATRRNHKGYIEVKDGQDHLVTKQPCVLVQRTTAKEQNRRLISAVLSRDFLDLHGHGVVIENHLNIVRPMEGHAGAELDAVSCLLNSRTVDYLFRCISGSVAVSAYELNALPMPDATDMKGLETLVRNRAGKGEIESFIARIYGLTE